MTTAEARGLIDRLAELAPAFLVLTGGDPMMRPDLFPIVEYAVSRGLRVSVSPTATVLTTHARLAHLRDLGVHSIHVSLDGATAETHDAFRGFSGSFKRTLDTLQALRALGMAIQVGTTVARRNVAVLRSLAALIENWSINVWSLFFLVPTGRGRTLEMVDVTTAEETWDWLADLAGRASFTVRTTAAPQFRRTLLRRKPAGASPRLTGAGYGIREAPAGVETRGVNDGKGFMFIDHVGNVCPSGFLQIPAGNIRQSDPGAIYREAPLFRQLRDLAALRGRCGRCRYADLCGGSRARAYAVNGSYLEEDPLCGIDVDG